MLHPLSMCVSAFTAVKIILEKQASVETEQEADPMKGKTPPQQTGNVTSPSGRPKRARRSRKPAESEVKSTPSKQNQELPKRILTALVGFLLPALIMERLQEVITDGYTCTSLLHFYTR